MSNETDLVADEIQLLVLDGLLESASMNISEIDCDYEQQALHWLQSLPDARFHILRDLGVVFVVVGHPNLKRGLKAAGNSLVDCVCLLYTWLMKEGVAVPYPLTAPEGAHV